MPRNPLLTPIRVEKYLGRRFGNLEVIGDGGYYLSSSNRKVFMLLCRCDCGNEKKIIVDAIAKGRSKSCGCYYSRYNSEENKNGLVAARIAYYAYQKGARDRGIEFDITFEFFVDITAKNCQYCGSEPNTLWRRKRSKKPDIGNRIMNGIDRVDSNSGYVVENCVPCCKDYNVAKMAMTKDQFFSHVKKIYEFLRLESYKSRLE